jgi:hypothetical protein
MDSDVFYKLDTLSRATGQTYGDIVRHALNLAYDWQIPLTGRKGQKNNLPQD